MMNVKIQEPADVAMKCYCPTCQADISYQGSTGNEPGDVALCIYCGEMLRFRENMQQTLLTEQDKIEIGGIIYTKLILAQNVLRRRLINILSNIERQ